MYVSSNLCAAIFLDLLSVKDVRQGIWIVEDVLVNKGNTTKKIHYFIIGEARENCSSRLVAYSNTFSKDTSEEKTFVPDVIYKQQISAYL